MRCNGWPLASRCLARTAVWKCVGQRRTAPERRIQGFDMDDVDLVHRVVKMGLKLKFVADPWVVHQYHGKTYDNPHNPPVTVDNRALWAEIKPNLTVRAQAADICGTC